MTRETAGGNTLGFFGSKHLHLRLVGNGGISGKEIKLQAFQEALCRLRLQDDFQLDVRELRNIPNSLAFGAGYFVVRSAEECPAAGSMVDQILPFAI